jgi:hypothetical protein
MTARHSEDVLWQFATARRLIDVTPLELELAPGVTTTLTAKRPGDQVQHLRVHRMQL